MESFWKELGLDSESARIVILQSDDVALVKSIAELRLDEDQRRVARVVDTVLDSARDADVAARLDTDSVASDRRFTATRDDGPVLGAVLMDLQRQTMAGLSLNLLRGEGKASVQDTPIPQGRSW